MIDEIQWVREARPEVPAYAPENRARARARLLNVPGTRPRRSRWVIAVSAAAAGTLTAGFLFFEGVEQTVSEPSIRPVSAVEYLEKAAQVVEKQHDVRPEPHQWLYEKILSRSSGGTENLDSETWMRFDGRFSAVPDGPDREIVTTAVEGEGGRNPLQRYDDLRSLSTDPGRLLAWAYETVDEKHADIARDFRESGMYDKLGRPSLEPRTEEDRHQEAFDLLGRLFEGVLAPPGLRAAAFRAIAEVPGVQVFPEAVDPLGRLVATITRMDGYGFRSEVLVDRTTYTSRGFGGVVVRDDMRRLPDGYVIGPDGKVSARPAPVRPVGFYQYELWEAADIVDKAGDRSS